MTWLRYVSRLWLWGGIGEPLVAKEIPEILRYIRGQFPHLNIHLSTNGKGLARIRPEWVDELNISVGPDGIDSDVERMIVRIMDRKHRPRIGMSRVLTRSNPCAIGLIIHAAALGCDWASFYHYDPWAYSYNRRSLPPEESFRDDADLWDEHIAPALEMAKKLDMPVRHCPPRPGTPGNSSQCLEPWTRMLLMRTWDGRRIMQPCCSRDMGWGMQWDDLDGGIMNLWNHPRMQEIREECPCKPADKL